jgi:hypothetical protein
MELTDHVSDAGQLRSSITPSNDDCGVTFFRGVMYAVTIGSVFWAVVAGLLLID